MSNDPQATPQPCTTDKLKFFVKKKKKKNCSQSYCQIEFIIRLRQFSGTYERNLQKAALSKRKLQLTLAQH